MYTQNYRLIRHKKISDLEDEILDLKNLIEELEDEITELNNIIDELETK